MAHFLKYLKQHHLALLALFIAIGGTSYAAAKNSIGSPAIKNNSVKGADVKNQNLTALDIRDKSLNATELKDNSLTTLQIAADSIQADEIQRNSIRASELAPNSVQSDEIDNRTIVSDDLSTPLLVPFTRVRTVQDVAAGASAEGRVECAAGQFALGGGVGFTDGIDPDDRVTVSHPETSVDGAQPSNGALASAWRGGMDNGAGTPRDMSVFVLCMER